MRRCAPPGHEPSDRQRLPRLRQSAAIVAGGLVFACGRLGYQSIPRDDGGARGTGAGGGGTGHTGAGASADAPSGQAGWSPRDGDGGIGDPNTGGVAEGGHNGGAPADTGGSVSSGGTATTGGNVSASGSAGDLTAGQGGQAGADPGGTGGTLVQVPVITAIRSSTGDGTYTLGASIDVSVDFSEPVALAGGTLDLTLDTGAVVTIAAFGLASSASSVYSVGAGEWSDDLDCTGIALAGGTLRSGVGIDADTALPSTTLADRGRIVVDAAQPIITAFAATTPSPTTSHRVSFTLAGSDAGLGITSWLVEESGVQPDPADPRWETEAPGTTLLSSGYGTRTLYAWAKDGASNVSEMTASSRLTVTLNYQGDYAWTFEKNIAGDDYLKGATLDYDDNLYVVGVKQNATGDWHITKLGPDGIEDTTDWDQSFDWYGGSDSAEGVVTDSNGNVYVSGWFASGTSEDWGIKKYTPDGTELWSREWDGGSGDDGAQGLAIDSHDNVYAVGYTTNAGGDLDWWMKKYRPDGSEDTTHWNFGFDGGYGADSSISVAVDLADDVYVAGRATTASGDSDWMVRKYTADGSLLWVQQYDRAGDTDWAHGVTVSPANGLVFVAGLSTAKNGNIDWAIKAYDAAGNEDNTWDKLFDYGEDDNAWSIGVDSVGNVWVGGHVAGADQEWGVAKFDSGGSQLSTDILVNTGSDWCRAIVVDSMDYVYGAGGVARATTGYDWYIKKYAP